MTEISYEFVDTVNPLGIDNCIIELRTVEGHSSDTSFHWHNALEITLVLEGEIQYIAEGIRHSVTAGDLVLINSGSIHLTENASPTSRIRALVLIIPDSYIKNLLPQINTPYFNFAHIGTAKEKIIASMQTICTYLNTTDRYQSLLIHRELLTILYQLFHSCYAEEHPSLKQLQLSQYLLQYVSEHYAEPLTVEEIASVAGLQKNYFCRLFKKETGLSFHQYLSRIRLNATLALYATKKYSLLDCALQSGFTNEKSAIEWCKKIYHCTPTDYTKSSHSTISLS